MAELHVSLHTHDSGEGSGGAHGSSLPRPDGRGRRLHGAARGACGWLAGAAWYGSPSHGAMLHGVRSKPTRCAHWLNLFSRRIRWPTAWHGRSCLLTLGWRGTGGRVAVAWPAADARGSSPAAAAIMLGGRTRAEPAAAARARRLPARRAAFSSQHPFAALHSPAARRKLITEAARELHRSNMARFDERSGNLYVTGAPAAAACPTMLHGGLVRGVRCRRTQAVHARPLAPLQTKVF